MKEKLIKAAFVTDPRVLSWARLRFEVKANDKNALDAAVERTFEMAGKGVEPQAGWLRDATDLGERLGQAWNVNPNEPVENVLKEVKKHADQRITPFPTNEDRVATGRLPLNPNSGPMRVREVVLGIPTTEIRAAKTVTITIQPYVTCRVRRIVIADEIARFVLFSDLKIGKNSMFGNADPIPGEVFSSRAFPLPLSCDTATPGQMIALTVTNWMGHNIMFSGALHGLGVE